MLRPPLRQSAMDVLLSLTTHTGESSFGCALIYWTRAERVFDCFADRPTRNIAILTIKRWVPDVQPLGKMGHDFAMHLLGRLKVLPSPTSSRQASTMPDGSQTPREESLASEKDGIMKRDASMVADLTTQENEKEEKSIVAVVENGKVVSGLPEPKTEAQVAQHIELLLGLVSKVPDLLDE